MPEGFEPTGSLVSGVEDGTIEIGFKCRMEGSTTPSSNCSATLKKGQFLAVSKDGQASALPRPPQFLQDDPFLDPLACAK